MKNDIPAIKAELTKIYPKKIGQRRSDQIVINQRQPDGSVPTIKANIRTLPGIITQRGCTYAGCRGVVLLGKAAVGDKTMVDTLAAAVSSLRASANRHEPLPLALKACAKAARLAAEGTIPMVAKKGRASYLGERSTGTQDPGATSAALLFETLSESVSPVSKTPQRSADQTLLLL